mgnify:FL=1
MNNFILILVFSIAFSFEDIILINSSSFTDWKYFTFQNGQIEEVIIDNPQSSIDWDIAVMRNHFRTNSGKSGPGYGGAYVDSSSTFNEDSWYELTELDAGIYFSPDSILDNIYDIITHTYSEAPGSLVLESWGWFDFDNNYQFNVNNYQYIIRTSLGDKIVKFWIKDYYNELGQSSHITLQYSDELDCIYDGCGVCNGDDSTCFDECADLGDINADLFINVLDIVELVNCVIDESCQNHENVCAADINQDELYNVLDIVALVTCVLNQDCQNLSD